MKVNTITTFISLYLPLHLILSMAEKNEFGFKNACYQVLRVYFRFLV